MPSPELEKALSEYKKDSLAYFPHEHEGWIIGKLESKKVSDDSTNVELEFTLETGEVDACLLNVSMFLTYAIKPVKLTFTADNLVKNAFADLPPLKNPEIMDLADDLPNFPTFTTFKPCAFLDVIDSKLRPAVFWGVKTRFGNRYIYTYSGIVLIAMNPFEYIDMYSVEVMREYAGKRRDELEPHLFAVAEEAYRAMLQGKNQSIIVSGESGAGKTQSTKYIMRYFATVDSLSKMDDVALLMRPELARGSEAGNKSEIEQAVLATNPILEAFGNAKTTRNDNSSRFGKFIELFFSSPDSGSVKITGAQIRTYLLERSRLVFQPATERNYHVFYQLCVAAPAAEKEELGLTTWQDYTYLNQGKAGVVRTIDDVEEFDALQKALSTVGVSVSMQWRIFRICAALLHLGNVKITPADNDSTEISDTDPALAHACRLLEIDKAKFKLWLTKRQMTMRGETFEKALKADQSLVIRDSVAKYIYVRLFDWLVDLVNKNLKRDSGQNQNFTGVLDIYGFEHFESNSFEQFCINYANEKLQQEFNSHVFRLEQELYIREKIVWKMIGFNDNQPCIDLIEGKLGILDLLDEESRLPTGSDASLVTKLNTRFAVPGQKFYAKPRFGNNSFTVKHYAVDVTYTVDGFIEKNKDTVPPEHLEVLNKSSFAFLIEVLATGGADSPPVETKKPVASDSSLSRRSTVSAKKPTLGSMFKGSLVQLMETIRATESHYIRCIKPNMEKSAFGFDGPMVLAQLRACGVLETIKISCAGYPNKMTHKQFANRYYLLVNSKFWDINERELSEMIVTTVISDLDKYQFGLTQVFLRSGQIAAFENRRTERQTYLMILGQKNIKRFIQRRRYLRMRGAAIKWQAIIRGFLARRYYKFLRETVAATKIQKIWRGYSARKLYNKKRTAAIKIQSVWRGYRARKYFRNIVKERAAVKIQAQWRGYIARKDYKLTLKKLIYIQSCIRRKYARRQLAALKAEAKSFGKLRELNYTLESKVVAVSQMLHERGEENKMLVEKVAHLEDQIRGWKERFSRVADDKKSITSELNANTANAKEIQTLTEQKDTITKERDRLAALLKKRDEEVALQTEELRRLRDRARIASQMKRPSTSSAFSVEESHTMHALRAENERLKRMLTSPNPNAHFLSSHPLSESPMPGTPDTYESVTASPRLSVQRDLSLSSQNLSIFASAPTLRPRPTVRRANTFIDGDIFTDAERERVKSGRPINAASASVIGRSPSLVNGCRSPSLAYGFVSSPHSSPPKMDGILVNGTSPYPKGVYGGMVISVPTPAANYTEEVAYPEEVLDAQATLLELPVLIDEIREALVLKLPITEDIAPTNDPNENRREYLFPAHLIGHIHGRIVVFFFSLQQPDDDFRPLFWTSNAHELVCVVYTLNSIESTKPNNRAQLNVLKKLQEDLDNLIHHVLSNYLEEVKKHVASMAVASVLETQDLPGLKSESTGFWGLFGGGGEGNDEGRDNMVTLKSFLSGLKRIMACYCLPLEYQQKVLSELVRVIAVTGFNALLKRRNFANFRRGCQIQYNVTQMEEWCHQNGIKTGPSDLLPLQQAAKVLTMNKTDGQDAAAICEVASLLKRSQMKKLLSNYPPSDPDSPMTQAFFHNISLQAESERDSQIFLSLEPEPTYPKASPPKG
ncbi:P-loop containing nucleoside triphosphate hydrolase protein [Chytridium lagenaria]|nr:P-loop containing nucleoside triphosphate hydrolase protein [Chytridium lagenaria]